LVVLLNITINMAGTFFGQFLNEGLELSVPDDCTLEKLLEILNEKYKTKVFNKKGLKNNVFVMIHNGSRVEPEELQTKLEERDVISILQPIMGG